jgi:hypothetical protein
LILGQDDVVNDFRALRRNLTKPKQA